MKCAAQLRDRLEPLVADECFVRPDLVQASAFGEPLPLAVFEQGGSMPGWGLGVASESLGLEDDSDQREDSAGSAIPGPNDFISPLGLVPAESFGGFLAVQSRYEPGFEPFALEPELIAGSIEV